MKRKVLVLMMALSVILTACAGNEAKETVTNSEVASSEAVSVADEAESETVAETETTETAGDFQPGTINETGYTSEWLGMSYTAPADTMMLTKEQMNEVMGLGQEALESNYSEEQLAQITEATSYEMMNQNATGLANVILSVEKLPLSFIDEEQYAQAFLDQYQNVEGMDVTVVSSDETVQVAGSDFRQVVTEIKYNGVTMTQKQFFKAKEGRMIVIALTYTEDTKDLGEEMINSFKAN